jgi:NADH-quinone oxidoreductase subunit J
MELLLFYLFAAVAVGASLLVVGQRNPMYSVLLVIAAFGALAGLYVLLRAPFVAVIQIIIYAGAIMVVFLFVVMLLNAPREDPATDDTLTALGGAGTRRVGALLAGLLGAELVWVLAALAEGELGRLGRGGPAEAPVRDIGRRLFTDYAVAVQATAVLTLVALVGAVVLAGRLRPTDASAPPSTAARQE